MKEALEQAKQALAEVEMNTHLPGHAQLVADMRFQVQDIQGRVDRERLDEERRVAAKRNADEIDARRAQAAEDKRLADEQARLVREHAQAVQDEEMRLRNVEIARIQAEQETARAYDEQDRRRTVESMMTEQAALRDAKEKEREQRAEFDRILAEEFKRWHTR